MTKPKLRPIKVKELIKQLQDAEQNAFVVMYNNELDRGQKNRTGVVNWLSELFCPEHGLPVLLPAIWRYISLWRAGMKFHLWMDK